MTSAYVVASTILAEVLLAVWLPKVAKVILFTFAGIALAYMVMLLLMVGLRIRGG